jgi:hypothetical protein
MGDRQTIRRVSRMRFFNRRLLLLRSAYLSGPSGLTPQMLEAGWRKLLDILAAVVAEE